MSYFIILFLHLLRYYFKSYLVAYLVTPTKCSKISYLGKQSENVWKVYLNWRSTFCHIFSGCYLVTLSHMRLRFDPPLIFPSSRLGRILSGIATPGGTFYASHQPGASWV